MSALVVILAVLDILVCIGLIVLVMLQKGSGAGLGSLAGNFETYLNKNKGVTPEDRLKKLTSVLAVAFAVLSIALYLLTGRG